MKCLEEMKSESLQIETRAPAAFGYFSKLPLEIRHKIYKHDLEDEDGSPRVIFFREDCNLAVPAIMRVCHEARREGMKRLNLGAAMEVHNILDTTSEQTKSYFKYYTNPATDMLVKYDYKNDSTAVNMKNKPMSIFSQHCALKQVRHVGLGLMDWRWLGWGPSESLEYLRSLVVGGSLESVTVFTAVPPGVVEKNLRFKLVVLEERPNNLSAYVHNGFKQLSARENWNWQGKFRVMKIELLSGDETDFKLEV